MANVTIGANPIVHWAASPIYGRYSTELLHDIMNYSVY